MKKAKTIGMMILYIIIFILAEIIGTILTLIYKMKTNPDFIDELYNTLMTLDVNLYRQNYYIDISHEIQKFNKNFFVDFIITLCYN